MTFTGEIHPLAASFPMMSGEDLELLADDIAANGLREPLVLDPKGRLIDGRNRLEGCTIAGVDPTFVEYDGDPTAFILSANVHRRHLSTGQRAAATALGLLDQDKRHDGRWDRGSVPADTSESSSTWAKRMAEAGLVADEDVTQLHRVLDGGITLDAAYNKAKDDRDDRDREVTRTATLRGEAADLAAEVVDGTKTLDQAWKELQARRHAHETAVTIARDALKRIITYLTSDGAPPEQYAKQTYTDEALAELDAADITFAAQTLSYIATRKAGTT